MVKKAILAVIMLWLPASDLFGQDPGIKLSGNVKSDFFYDSRQTVSVREGHFLLYPTGIWISYFKLSDRVKATFVR